MVRKGGQWESNGKKMDLCTWKDLTVSIAALGPVASFFLAIFLTSIYVSYICVPDIYDIFKVVVVSIAAGNVNLFYRVKF